MKPHPLIADAFYAAIKEERRQEKAWLRNAIKKKAYRQIFEYCVGKHPKSAKSIRDVFIYGYSEMLIDENHTRWVWRYFERLTGLKS